jgi:hypothetical protein
MTELLVALGLIAGVVGAHEIGFGCSAGPPVFSAPVLALALWMTIDLDYPGIGLIRVSNLPIAEALAAMK